MKKSLAFITLIVLFCLLFSFIGCTFKDFASEDGENLFKKATLTNANGDKIKASTKQAVGEVINVKLSKATTINTIVLGESKSIITNFELSYKDMTTGEMTTFYKQDLVEDYRYCTFPSINTDTVQIKVTSTRDNKKWNLNKLRAYNIVKTASEDFVVFGYGMTGYAYDGVDPAIFDTVNHIDIIRSVNFDEQGNLHFASIERDGKTIDGQTVFETELANYRKAIGERDVKIVVTIMNNGGDVIQMHNSVFTTHKDNFIANVIAFAQKYDIDGVGLDYEYCYDGSDYKKYGNFIKDFQQALPDDIILSLAMSTWQFKTGLFPKNALPYIDMIQLMTYDLFDDYNYHGAFQYSVMDAISEFAFYAGKQYLSKVNLGLPFYARPTGEWTADWIDFNKWAEDLPQYKFGNKVDYWTNIVKSDYQIQPGNPQSQCSEMYFNSPQMIFDKVSFALDNKLGGVMFWHLGCDVPYQDDYSLIRTINRAIENRK